MTKNILINKFKYLYNKQQWIVNLDYIKSKIRGKILYFHFVSFPAFIV